MIENTHRPHVCREAGHRPPLALLPEARASVAGNALLGPMADRVEGQAAIAAGDREQGARRLRQSAAAFRRLHAVFELSRTESLLR